MIDRLSVAMILYSSKVLGQRSPSLIQNCDRAYNGIISCTHSYPMPTFPAIKPDYFSDIQMPEYKGKDIEFDDGNVQTVVTQFRASRLSFSLRYGFLTVPETESLMLFWRTVLGTNGRFDLPDIVLRMPSAIVTQVNLLNAGGNVWRFSSAYTFMPVTADRGNECSRYSTSIAIRGELK